MNVIKSIFGGIFKRPKPSIKEIRDINRKVLYLPREDFEFKTYETDLHPWRIFPYYSG